MTRFADVADYLADQHLLAQHAGPARPAGEGRAGDAARARSSRRAAAAKRAAAPRSRSRPTSTTRRWRRSPRRSSRRASTGMIVSNTTIAREGVGDLHAPPRPAACPGRPLFRRSTAMLAKLRRSWSAASSSSSASAASIPPRPPSPRSRPAPISSSSTPAWSIEGPGLARADRRRPAGAPRRSADFASIEAAVGIDVKLLRRPKRHHASTAKAGPIRRRQRQRSVTPRTPRKTRSAIHRPAMPSGPESAHQAAR